MDIKHPDGSSFRCSDNYLRRWLRLTLGWSERRATRDAHKLPNNWEDLCYRAFMRLVYCIKEHDIPSELFVNTDQTQVVYAPGSKLTWAKKGSKQVSVVGLEEKRAMTLVVSVGNSGQLLPFQAIYSGITKRSCPSPSCDKYKEAHELGIHFNASGNATYWSTLETMKLLVDDIVAPYFAAQKQKLNLPQHHKCIWQIDVWSVHRSHDFREWVSKTHPDIILHYVPAGCTGVFQACDVGIQRILKHSLKRSYQRDVVEGILEQLQQQRKDIELHQKIGELRNGSVKWIWEAYHVVNKEQIVKRVSQLSAFLIMPLTSGQGLPTLSGKGL